MASFTEIARPYAKAAFEMAEETGKFESWYNAIRFAEALDNDRDFKSVLRKTRKARVPELIEKLAEGIASGPELRFVQELVLAGRLNTADKIREAFTAFHAEKEGFASLLITSSKPVDTAEGKALVSALERQFGKKLKASFKVDPAIEGGFIARVGDKVYDASVRGALERISNALLN
jgi:F-type H+-transporting ATPase subunit delta